MTFFCGLLNGYRDLFNVSSHLNRGAPLEVACDDINYIPALIIFCTWILFGFNCLSNSSVIRYKLKKSGNP